MTVEKQNITTEKNGKLIQRTQEHWALKHRTLEQRTLKLRKLGLRVLAHRA